MMLLALGIASLFLYYVRAATPVVDIDVQQLFNSSGTQYPTDFTRDIVPVCPSPANLIQSRKESTLTMITGEMFLCILHYLTG